MNPLRPGKFWTAFERIGGFLTAHASGVHQSLRRRRTVRRLRLSETLSLGEKRFLAVVQFQQQEFLVGGTGNSIALLAKLDTPACTPGNEE